VKARQGPRLDLERIPHRIIETEAASADTLPDEIVYPFALANRIKFRKQYVAYLMGNVNR